MRRLALFFLGARTFLFSVRLRMARLRRLPPVAGLFSTVPQAWQKSSVTQLENFLYFTETLGLNIIPANQARSVLPVCLIKPK